MWNNEEAKHNNEKAKIIIEHQSPPMISTGKAGRAPETIETPIKNK